MFDQDIDCLSVFLVLLVDHKGLFVQPMLGSDLRNLCDVVVLQLVNVPNDLALICPDGGKKQEVLEIAVVTEGRRLDYDLFEQFNELQGKISFDEGMDGDGHVIGISALWQDSGNNLWHTSQLITIQWRHKRASPDRSKRDDGYCLAEELDPKGPPHAS